MIRQWFGLDSAYCRTTRSEIENARWRWRKRLAKVTVNKFKLKETGR